MAIKPAFTVAKQIQLLQERGLIIDDQKQADFFLLKNNYYRLNIYFHKYMSVRNRFQPGITFSDVVSSYLFDRWLRRHLLSLLEPIEIEVKTRTAYHLALTYGSDCFYKPALFKKEDDFLRVVKDFDNERNRNYKDPIIVHHETRYSGIFPIWVVVEFLSFKGISNLYSCLQENDKKRIAGSTFGINEYYLGQWLHVLSVLRNICAHYGYLFQREFSVRPRLYRDFGWDVANNGSLFAICLVLKRISEKSRWQDFLQFFDNTMQGTKKYTLKDYGFPNNWLDYLA